MSLSVFRVAALFIVLAGLLLASAGCTKNTYSLAQKDTPYAASYAIVVSAETYALEDWRAVADALAAKHPGAALVIHEGAVANARDKLAAQMPLFTAFVARPGECGREYIAEVHRLTRKLDDDPWLDTHWGVITGTTAKDALRLATAPARTHYIRRALATTNLDDRLLDELSLVSDETPGAWAWKKPDKTFPHGRFKTAEEDVAAWAEHLSIAPDLIATASNSSGGENGFEMPFNRGAIRVARGTLYPFTDVRQTQPAEGAAPLLASASPKVWFPLGNNSAAHVNAPLCLATVMLGEHGANQAAGYTVDTWFGCGGRDILALWQAHPGRNTFAESFFFNQQWMLASVAALDPKGLDYKIRRADGTVKGSGHVAAMVAAGLKFDPRNLREGDIGKSPDRRLAGLLWEMDAIAFYGDPAWRVLFDRPKEMNSPYSADVNSEGDRHVFKIVIHNAAEHAQDKTPVGLVFGTRLKNVRLLSGAEYEPVLADNFILLLKPHPAKGEAELRVEFAGEPVVPLEALAPPPAH
jgi:zinc protease